MSGEGVWQFAAADIQLRPAQQAERDAARQVVASHAHNPADLADLLHVLGLDGRTT